MGLMLSNTLKSQISKIFWITIGWTFIAVFYFFSIYASLIDLERDTSDMDPWLYFKGSLLTGILAGTIGGSIVVFFWEKWLRTKNYGWSLLSMLWTFTFSKENSSPPLPGAPPTSMPFVPENR